MGVVDLASGQVQDVNVSFRQSSFARFGTTVSQAGGEGERPVLRRTDLLHCVSTLGFGGGSVRRINPRLRKTVGTIRVFALPPIMTELHYAAYCGDLNAMRNAIDAGTDVNSVDTYRGYTPVLWLAEMAAVGGPRLEMLSLLVEHGADINIRAADGAHAVQLAREAGTAGGHELAKALVALGCDVN